MNLTKPLIPTRIAIARNNWLRENDKKVIMSMDRIYKRQFRVLTEINNDVSHQIWVMEHDKEFVEEHPEYSDMILDREKFEQNLIRLKKEDI